DVRAIPERLQEPVGEAEEQHVMDRTLPEVVVDPEDRRFVERPEEDTVELPRRGAVVTERFLDDHARPLHRPRLAELVDDQLEERGWTREVVRGPAGGPELPADGLEGGGVPVVAVHVAKPLVELAEGLGIEPAVALDAVLGAGPELLESPAGLGHADDRN